MVQTDDILVYPNIIIIKIQKVNQHRASQRPTLHSRTKNAFLLVYKFTQPWQNVLDLFMLRYPTGLWEWIVWSSCLIDFWMFPSILGQRKIPPTIQRLLIKTLWNRHVSSGQNYMLNLMPCTNEGRPLWVVRISVFPEVSQMGYRYRVVPDRLWRFCATSERPRRSKTK